MDNMFAAPSDHTLWQRFKHLPFIRAAIMFSILLGPGLITSNVDNDAGGITTYSLAGADYGLKLLWTLIPITLALVIVQEMGARMGVVSGKGLSDLIRERFGAKITFYLMITLILANLGNTISEFAGIAASLEIFGVSRLLSVPFAAVFVWWLVVKGNYKTVEKVFLFACTFYLAYIISGFMGKPDWPSVGKAFLTPVVELNKNFMAMALGIIGTTIAPWMQFYLQASVVDKGIKIGDYRYTRLDVILGSFTVNVVAFFIIMLCAVTLSAKGIHIETAKDAALALEPFAGTYCTWLFALGLLNASLFAASILPLSTSYTICEAFGWESGLDHKFMEAPQFYSLYSFMIILGAFIIMLPGIPLIKVMFYSQVINGLLLPFILIFMLLLINDKRIMGVHTNGPIMNMLAWLTAAVIIVISLVMIVLAFV